MQTTSLPDDSAHRSAPQVAHVAQGEGVSVDAFAAAIAHETAQMEAGEGFVALPELPGVRYTDPGFTALENERLWRRSWLNAGRTSMLARPGDYLVFRKAGASILVVRGKDGAIRAFQNACRHRGASVVREDCGHAGLLRCQFHSWSYNLEGKLVGVPEKNGFPGLDMSARGLLPVACETFEGWIFVNQDPEAEDLMTSLGAVADDMRAMAMADLRLVDRRIYRAEANWKVTLDAFLESYHLDTIHPKTAALMNDAQSSAIRLFPGGHAWQASHRRQALSNGMVDDGRPDVSGIASAFREYAITYNLFPNWVSPIDPVGSPFLMMWPDGPAATEIEIYFLGPDWGEGPRPAFYDSYFAFFEQLVEEDMGNLAAMQRSLESGYFPGALLNHNERRIYWNHQAIDARIGADRIAPAMRMKPVLTAD